MPIPFNEHIPRSISDPIPAPVQATHSDLNSEQTGELRISQRNHQPPLYLRNYHCNILSYSSTPYSLDSVLSYDKVSSSTFEPKNYKEASIHKEWCEAMNMELDAMAANNTWTIMPLPPNKNTVGCRWVYKVKHGSNGTIERYKARLMAKGFNQKEGIDYFETYSPVAKLVTVKLILAIDAIKKWNMVQLGVNNVFLNGDLHEEVFMDIPPGLNIQGDLMVHIPNLFVNSISPFMVLNNNPGNGLKNFHLLC